MGGLIRYNNGLFTIAFLQNFVKATEVDMVEVLTIIEGIVKACKVFLFPLIMESDSSRKVKMINGESCLKTNMEFVNVDIKILLL